MCLRRSFRLLVLSLAVFSLGARAAAQTPVGEVFTSDATVKGPVLRAGGGTRVMSGSSVTAGQATATLKLVRGGEVRVCRSSSVAVASSPTGHELMLSMNTGAIELHYLLAGSTDTVMTPDFQVSLAGPGAFHFAISADERGNTCVQALPASTRPVTITELMGDGSYTLKPGEDVFFRAGRISHPGSVSGTCGCPPPPPVLRATPQPPKPEEPAAAALPPAVFSLPPASPAAVTAPAPPEKPGEVHVQVDAPFVFRAADPTPEVPVTAVHVQLSSLPILSFPQVLPPPPETKAPEPPVVAQAKPSTPKKKGFWARIASFFKG